MEPLPRLASKRTVTSRFRALVYSVINGGFGSRAVRKTGRTEYIPSGATYVVWVEYFAEYEDDIPQSTSRIRERIKSYISSDPHLLDLLQYMARRGLLSETKFEKVQDLLRSELIGYRFIGRWDDGTATLIPVSDNAEADANQRDYAELNLYPKAAEHFRQSAEEIKAGHYRGSVAESISGVESVIKSLTKKPSVTLGDGLKLLAKDGDLNPALKAGLDKIYGWTNSPSGMRHALSDESKEITEAEARFMLSACLAFAAWLKRSFPEA